MLDGIYLVGADGERDNVTVVREILEAMGQPRQGGNRGQVRHPGAVGERSFWFQVNPLIINEAMAYIAMMQGQLMHRVTKWWLGLSSQVRASFGYSFAIVGFISTIMSVLGLTLKDYVPSLRYGFAVIVATYGIVWLLVFLVIGRLYRHSISLIIRSTRVSVKVGDIFNAEGLRVIGCDNCFDTRVDDVVIAKNSLQGQLVLGHGSAEEIRLAVEAEARKRGIEKGDDGRYTFPSVQLCVTRVR